MKSDERIHDDRARNNARQMDYWIIDNRWERYVENDWTKW